MTETVNAHQPVTATNRIDCAATDCGYAMHTYHPPQGSIDWAHHFRQQHTAQYEPGRAPDITVDWEISACCSVCPDGIGKVVTNDSETVMCEECNTYWNIDGTCGERN